ncbi:MAG: hypothetical protein JNM56_34610 [Planctomycetia bacterium]|nr:hypothetical protein [Planctomycetia bacterium]
MTGKLVRSVLSLALCGGLASPAGAQQPGMAFPYWNAPAPQALPMPVAPVYAPPQRIVQIPVLVGSTDYTRVNLAEPAPDAAAPQAAEKAVPPTATERPVLPPATDTYTYSRCGGQAGWSAGAGAYILKPMLSDRTAFVTTAPLAGANPVTTVTPFDWNFSVSPLVWLGYTGENGLGVQLRWFRFDHASDSVGTSNPDVINGIRQAPGLPDPETQAGGPIVGLSLFQSPTTAPGDVLTFGSDIRIETLDLELTRRFTAREGALWVSGGARYLQCAMDYNGVLVNPAVPITETVSFGHNFYAAGPTLAFGGYWYLDTNRWAVILNTRGSLLVGNSRENFTSAQLDVASLSNFSTQLDDAVVPIGEIELGLAWTPDLGNVATIVQATVVNQTYFGVGSPSSTDGDLSLFGFQVSFGLGY